MKKERKMAIYGIILPVIGLFALAGTSNYDQTYFTANEKSYIDAIQNLIWVQTIIFVLFFYQLFYYITYLCEGVKGKSKSLVTFSIIGLGLSIGLLLSSIGGARIASSLIFSFGIHTPYSIIFSIVMFFRSFFRARPLTPEPR